MGSEPELVGTARWTPVNLPWTAGEQAQATPLPSRQGWVRLQLLGFLCHHTHQEVPPASISAQADPRSLLQMDFELLPNGQ